MVDDPNARPHVGRSFLTENEGCMGEPNLFARDPRFA